MENIKEIAPTNYRELGDKYIDAFVTFIDILGFKNIVDNENPEKINKLLDAVKGFSSLPQRRRPPYDQSQYLPIVTQFSDSIIRIQPTNDLKVDDVDIMDFFLEEVTSLTITQGNLACNGILIRGGMTYGKICIHNNRIFGPAFNRAYYLESKLAKYPRIIIDEFLCTKNANIIVDDSKYNWSDVASQLYELLECTDDGLWSLDYLPIIFEAERSTDIKNEEVLVVHRNAIKDLLTNALKQNNEDILMKIRWIASYHNRIINRSFKTINERYENNYDSLIVDLN